MKYRVRLSLRSSPYSVQPTYKCNTFVRKEKVFDASVMSSLSYSSESWITSNIKGMEKQYNKLIKCLLGVRRNTSVNLCMLEAGIPSFNCILDTKKRTFLMSKRDRVDNE